jgi:hypothetical protein
MNAIDTSEVEGNDTVEQVEAELGEQIGSVDVTEKIREFKQDQAEVAEQLMNITNGGEISRSDLRPDEQAEYDRLEQRLFHLDSVIDAVEQFEVEE